MDTPHPCWADHNHSDEHLNLMFAIPGPETGPSRPYRAHRDHSDEHSLFPPPSISPDDSGYCSPSELHSESRKKPSRSVDATPIPPPLATRLLVLEEDSEDDVPERRAERPCSSGWSFSKESSINRTSEGYDTGDRSRRKSIFGLGLRRACKRVRAAVVAAATKISRGGSGAEQGCGRGVGGWDGAAGGYGMMRGSVRFREGKRKKVYKKVKRTLLRRQGPVHLKQATVRTPLDE